MNWSGAISGETSYRYDNGFRIIEERVNGANAVALTYDADGQLSTVGALAARRDVATGSMGDTGDGGPARLANLESLALVAAAPDGSVYIGTGNSKTIRMVSAAGIITRVVGTGGFCVRSACPAVLNMPALQIPFSQLKGLDVSPDNVLHFTDRQFRVAMRVTKPLPGFDGADIAVASEDGSALYRFDASGRHLTTRNSSCTACRSSILSILLEPP